MARRNKRRRKQAESTVTEEAVPSQRPRRRWVLPAMLLYPFAEFGATVLLTRWLGAPTAFAFYAVPAAVGLLVQRHRFGWVKAFWRELDSSSKKSKKRTWTDTESSKLWAIQFYWLTVILLLVPGVLSHIVAIYLLVRTPRFPGSNASSTPAAAG